MMGLFTPSMAPSAPLAPPVSNNDLGLTGYSQNVLGSPVDAATSIDVTPYVVQRGNTSQINEQGFQTALSSVQGRNFLSNYIKMTQQGHDVAVNALAASVPSAVASMATMQSAQVTAPKLTMSPIQAKAMAQAAQAIAQTAGQLQPTPPVTQQNAAALADANAQMADAGSHDDVGTVFIVIVLLILIGAGCGAAYYNKDKLKTFFRK